MKERGWRSLDSGDGRESDIYDYDATVYVVALDADAGNGEIVGCFRLYPTTGPSMLRELFPYLVDGDPPNSPDIVEASRLAIARNRRAGLTYYELLGAMLEYGLHHNLTGAIAVTRSYRMPIAQAAGIRVTPLGLPHDIGGESMLAIKMHIETDASSSLRRLAQASGPLVDPADLQPAGGENAQHRDRVDFTRLR